MVALSHSPTYPSFLATSAALLITSTCAAVPTPPPTAGEERAHASPPHPPAKEGEAMTQSAGLGSPVSSVAAVWKLTSTFRLLSVA